MRKSIILFALAILLVFILGGCARFRVEEPQDEAPPDEIEYDLDEDLAEIKDQEQDADDDIEVGDMTSDREGYEIMPDLSGLNLINHDFDDSALLAQATLRTAAGGDVVDVIVFNEGYLSEENGRLQSDNEAWTMRMSYSVRQYETAVDSVIWSMEFDKGRGVIEPGATLAIGPVRTSADEQTAMLVVLDEDHVILFVYMAQDVPGNDEVVVLYRSFARDLGGS